ncbi:MAG: bifunctional aspartate kinase/homoserine dehydrogenase I [Pseudomonadota bacterium]
MIVLKFGGTSLATAPLFSSIARIVGKCRKEDKLAVVVSACADTTDRLLEATHHAAEGHRDEYERVLNAIGKFHLSLAGKAVGKRHGAAIKKIIKQHLSILAEHLEGIALLHECSTRAKDFIVGHGELLSSAIVAATLRSKGIASEPVDARNFIVTDNSFGQANIDTKVSFSRVRRELGPLIKRCVPVITGFVGATIDKIPTTIGRGGSDLTATFIGASLKAKRVEIWTDVEGVLSADPRIVPDAFTLSRLSYAEVMELAYFGAKVVYPKAIAPLIKPRIPLLIKSTIKPQAIGTIISNRTDPSVIKGITSIENISLITLEGSGIIGVRGIAGRMFSALARKNVNVIMISQASSEQSVCCAVNASEVETAINELRFEFELELKRGHVARIGLFDDMMIIAVVGEGMRGTPGVAGRLFSALGRNRVNVVAIAQGSSEINISFVIEAKNKVRALNLIHGAFHLSTNRINLFVMGKGTIGGKLLEQISDNRDKVRKNMGIDLRVVGIADSKRFIFDRATVDLRCWRTLLKKSHSHMDGKTVIDSLWSTGLENLIVVDATAAQEMAKLYPHILRSGMCIITPNKRANTLPIKQYYEIMQARGPARARYLYETTVGAGLPIISTLRDLIDSGDTILSIQGVFSGTMSFIFSSIAQGLSFSKAVLLAREKGFTEPDPRDDLCGQDVARKLLILAREIGSAMEMKSIKVENLVPASMRKLPLQKFLKQIDRLDDIFAKVIAKADADGKSLQYCGRLQEKRATVGITKVPKSFPLARMKPGDNMVIFTTERYRTNPLIVQGPGAGPDVTAGGVFADILRAAQYLLK